MPRTDRLFDLIQILRDGRLHRAQDLAQRLEVSIRTIYRDMDTLIASGVPIAGDTRPGLHGHRRDHPAAPEPDPDRA